eukprot:gb/GECH01003898.1/.p1 GENE.gb/GECH01003898.1/~~gb/GECH01003898.1/.p1  ORF type:complete len:121 (+),score=13.27 gb/GECH01003898.1/:1-363(+)
MSNIKKARYSSINTTPKGFLDRNLSMGMVTIDKAMLTIKVMNAMKTVEDFLTSKLVAVMANPSPIKRFKQGPPKQAPTAMEGKPWRATVTSEIVSPKEFPQDKTVMAKMASDMPNILPTD